MGLTVESNWLDDPLTAFELRDRELARIAREAKGPRKLCPLMYGDKDLDANKSEPRDRAAVVNRVRREARARLRSLLGPSGEPTSGGTGEPSTERSFQ